MKCRNARTVAFLCSTGAPHRIRVAEPLHVVPLRREMVMDQAVDQRKRPSGLIEPGFEFGAAAHKRRFDGPRVITR